MLSCYERDLLRVCAARVVAGGVRRRRRKVYSKLTQ